MIETPTFPNLALIAAAMMVLANLYWALILLYLSVPVPWGDITIMIELNKLLETDPDAHGQKLRELLDEAKRPKKRWFRGGGKRTR